MVAPVSGGFVVPCEILIVHQMRDTRSLYNLSSLAQLRSPSPGEAGPAAALIGKFADRKGLCPRR
jgi:hypothetical protein